MAFQHTTKLVAVLVFLFIFLSSIYPQNSLQEKEQGKEEEKRRVEIRDFLLLGPAPVRFPAIPGDKNEKGEVAGLLKFPFLPEEDLWPAEGESIAWFDGQVLSWKPIHAEEGRLLLPASKKEDPPQVVYLATYLKSPQWMKVKLTLTGPESLCIFLDGKPVTEKPVPKGKEEKSHSSDLTLLSGKHLVLVKIILKPFDSPVPPLKAEIELPSKKEIPAPEITTSPTHPLEMKQLLDLPILDALSLSPDGELVAITLKKTLPPSDETETWVEIRSAKNGKRVQTFRGSKGISNPLWAPTGQRLTFITREEKKATLWLLDKEGETCRPILKDQENLQEYQWSPDGTFIIYSVSDKPEEDPKGVKRLRALQDRQEGWRKKSFLCQIFIESGIGRRLTAGSLATSLQCISPDNSKAVVTRGIEDTSVRPYAKTEVFLLDLHTLKAKLVTEAKWFRSAFWSPEGKKLLFLGGPSFFEGLGSTLPKGKIPNDYDIQAYFFDLEGGKAEAVAKDFDPSIEGAFWSPSDGSIYFLATNRSNVDLFRYKPDTKTFKKLETGVDVVEAIDFAHKGSFTIYRGSSILSSPKLYAMDLREGVGKPIFDPGEEAFRHVELGEAKEWSFQNASGERIIGRVYTPPALDPSLRHPCIVYYYGGTFPVTRSFSSRYPWNLWASKGYVVFVLQPSGCIGFGQKFSACHVNDWGKIAAKEIIEGTRKFLKAHPFVDPERVGCIGASYGGFMTMYLLTRTDIFAAAVAHAGISALSSYWGEGTWGYAYNAVAAAESFPWNHPDLYIKQGALFNADKIKTPLLLTHGAEDNNVPPGESAQLYTALKLLGREVEYIQVQGENHTVLTRSRRIVWWNTILAWFDRHLKKEPEFWESLYGKQK